MTPATPPIGGGRRRRPVLLALLGVLLIAGVVGVVVAVTAPRDGATSSRSTVDMEERVDAIAKRFPDGYPQHSILLTGSSSFGRWTTSKEDLRPLETYNLGIGGTTVADHLAHLDSMIAPFDPRAVLVYVGANDISGDADGLSGAETADAAIEYLGRLEEVAPDAEVFYVEIAETPAREAVREEVETANDLIRAYADTDDRVVFVPTAEALLTPEGAIDPSLFVEDGLHFDDAGYDRFAEAIRSVVLPALE
jgi:lysophospholipase L1-like esterase